MKAALVVLALLITAAHLYLAVELASTFRDMRAVDRQVKYCQDFGRQNEILYMRDLARLCLQAESWINIKQAPDKREVEQLERWFDDDFSELSAIVQKNEEHPEQYLQAIQRDWHSFKDELDATNKAIAGNNAANAQAHFALLGKKAQELTRTIQSKELGVTNPGAVTGDMMSGQVKLGQRFDQFLMAAICLYMVMAISLAAFWLTGPKHVLNKFSNNSTLVTKFFLVSGTPILFEVVFLGVLALMFYHTYDAASRIQTDRTIDRHFGNLYRLVVGLASQPDNHLAQAAIRENIAVLRTVLRNRQQQQYSLDVIEQGTTQMAQLNEKAKQAHISCAAKTELLMRTLAKEVFERTIIYVRYGFANVGQQEMLKVKLSIAAEQVEMARRLQLAMLLGIALSIALAFLLVSYFNRSAGRRLAMVSENIFRFGSGDSLLPPLSGTDEITKLDNFFHEMAAAVDEASRRERAVINGASDIICSLDIILSVDINGKFVFINPAVLDVWGYEPDKIKGKLITDLILDADVPETLAALKRLQDDHTAQVIENRVIKADGSAADMRWSCQWSATENLIFCVLQDISDRKQIERLKQEFIAIVSHDLRTPINAAHAFLELLDMGAYGELSGKGQRELEKDLAGLKSLSELILDLLDIERMEAGQLELEYAPVNALLVIDECAKSAQAHAHLKRVKITTETTESVDSSKQITADQERFKQLLVNLLAASIQISQREANIHLMVSCLQPFLTVTVTVDKVALTNLSDSVFETYRAHEIPDTTECGGRKLALPLCRAIAKQHGGWIKVDRTSDGCFAFLLSLPVVSDSIAAAEKVSLH